MRYFNFLALSVSLCALGTMSSCSDDFIVESENLELNSDFTLIASTKSDTRAQLGQDNLTLTWEVGDKLFLLSKTSNEYMTLTAQELLEDGTSAKFKSDNGGVPAGDYWVLFNIDPTNPTINTTCFYDIDKVNDPSKKLIKLRGEVSIKNGESSKSLSLSHVYAKLSLELEAPDEWWGTWRPMWVDGHTDANGMWIDGYYDETNVVLWPNDRPIFFGMISPRKGFVNSATLNSTGQFVSNAREKDPRLVLNPRYNNCESYYYYTETEKNNLFGDQGTLNKTPKLSAFVIPTDLTDEASPYVYFYVFRYNGSNGFNVYEIKKTGINLEAGKNYNMKISIKDLTPVTLQYVSDQYSYSINTVEQLRAAKYVEGVPVNNSSASGLTIDRDIDCKATEGTDPQVFPLRYYNLYGNNHIISNMEMDWGYEGTGLLSPCYSSTSGNMAGEVMYGMTANIFDLTLQDVNVKGTNYVGAFSGTGTIRVNNTYGGYNTYGSYVLMSNCKLTGTSAKGSHITGNDYVGGLVAQLVDYKNILSSSREAFIEESYVDNYCTISGRSYVGGITGSIANGDSYWGENNRDYSFILKSGNKGTVNAEGDYAGGICGDINVNNPIQQYTEDGIVKYYRHRLWLCYNTGIVNGNKNVGGIVGSVSCQSSTYDSADASIIYQCFNEGDITALESNAGGIVGFSRNNIDQSRNKGNVTSNSFAGGIAGQSGNVYNCYSMNGTVSSNIKNVGGVVGGLLSDWGYEGSSNVKYIKYCYSSSPVVVSSTNSSGKGILGTTDGNAYIFDCVTNTDPSSYSTSSTNYRDDSYILKTGEKISDFQTVVGKGNAYSTVTWGDALGSLKLTWETEFDAEGGLPGFGNVNW